MQKTACFSRSLLVTTPRIWSLLVTFSEVYFNPSLMNLIFGESIYYVVNRNPRLSPMGSLRLWAQERPCKLLIFKHITRSSFLQFPKFGHLLVTISYDTLSSDTFFYIDLCCLGFSPVVVKHAEVLPLIPDICSIVVGERDLT